MVPVLKKDTRENPNAEWVLDYFFATKIDALKYIKRIKRENTHNRIKGVFYQIEEH